MMKLNSDNYYSPKANWEYMSNSQYKNFKSCEARTMAQLKGEYVYEPSKSMLMGSYIDSAVEGTLPQFKAAHPEIFLKDGSRLRAEYRRADEILKAMKEQTLFMEFLEGEKQSIFTGEIAGVPFKAKTDVINYDKGRIVDLKTTGGFTHFWDSENDDYMNLVYNWGYQIQGAIYQELVRQKLDDTFPFYLAIVTTEKVPDFRLVEVDQWILDNTLEKIKQDVNKFQAIKDGIFDPERCEYCDYCVKSREVKKVFKLSELDDYLNPINNRWE